MRSNKTFSILIDILLHQINKYFRLNHFSKKKKKRKSMSKKKKINVQKKRIECKITVLLYSFG